MGRSGPALLEAGAIPARGHRASAIGPPLRPRPPPARPRPPRAAMATALAFAARRAHATSLRAERRTRVIHRRAALIAHGRARRSLHGGGAAGLRDPRRRGRRAARAAVINYIVPLVAVGLGSRRPRRAPGRRGDRRAPADPRRIVVRDRRPAAPASRSGEDSSSEARAGRPPAMEPGDERESRRGSAHARSHVSRSGGGRVGEPGPRQQSGSATAGLEQWAKQAVGRAHIRASSPSTNRTPARAVSSEGMDDASRGIRRLGPASRACAQARRALRAGRGAGGRDRGGRAVRRAV